MLFPVFVFFQKFVCSKRTRPCTRPHIRNGWPAGVKQMLEWSRPLIILKIDVWPYISPLCHAPVLTLVTCGADVSSQVCGGCIRTLTLHAILPYKCHAPRLTTHTSRACSADLSDNASTRRAQAVDHQSQFAWSPPCASLAVCAGGWGTWVCV
jgi:hypothetical protein